MSKLCVFFAVATGVLAVSAKSDGTCGYQCTQDSDCGGCGTAGKCSCPDGQTVKFFQESCSCVSAPTNPPVTPAVDVADSIWPAKWTATVDAWCYGDWSDKTTTASGKFMYDEALGRTRADWTPFTNGKDAKQVWVSSENGGSMYYVKSKVAGPISFCLKFPITDPGQQKAPVGVEKKDWMKACNDAGLAHHVGREQVEGEWADHWSCRLDYAAANQSITFQNWHSLGLGNVPKGLPVRVTGGNSAPNPTQGSPRMNSVWYKNFVTGDNASSEDDFSVSDFHFCIPVGKKDVKSFFGHDVSAADVMSPRFQRRAHYFPMAKASSNDLRRAKQPKPSNAFTRDNFADSMKNLNGILLGEKGLTTKSCRNFTGAELREVQGAIYEARVPELDNIYTGAGDTRRMIHSGADSLEKAQDLHKWLEQERPELSHKAHDGICHEIVMWYVHHLSKDIREEIKQRIVLPLLPVIHHGEEPTPDADHHAHNVHGLYKAQVSCAICHLKGGSEVITV